MTVIQSGSINTAAFTVPDLYVQIVPPNNSLINGVPTNILGLVGIGSWGPVNSPTGVGNLAQGVQTFGPIQALKYDLCTAIDVACKNGANNIMAVRVTDGTDAAATIAVPDGSAVTGITLTALYTGTVGNTISVTVAKGSGYVASTNLVYKITLALPGGVPEIFDNIALSGSSLWTNAVNAINLGQGNLRGPSQLCTATIGTSTVAPALATYTLAAGANGNTTITGTVLIGVDTVPRKGMYALRNTGASVVVLVDDDDSTTYSAQVTYGLSEGSYMIMTGPAGQSIASATSALTTAGIDSYTAKCMLGDWCLYQDLTNNQNRYISPQAYVAGVIASQNPSNSSLNKQIAGLLGTQKSVLNQVYSEADLQNIAIARIDVISKPAPGGNYFAARFGLNTSSDKSRYTDNYTRMTYFLAYTLNAAMGSFVGQLQSATTQLHAKNTIQGFLAGLQQQNMIGNSNGTIPYSVVLDSTNNTAPRVALGYMQCDVAITYLSVIQYFLINMQGGQGVQIQILNAQPTTSFL